MEHFFTFPLPVPLNFLLFWLFLWQLKNICHINGKVISIFLSIDILSVIGEDFYWIFSFCLKYDGKIFLLFFVTRFYIIYSDEEIVPAMGVVNFLHHYIGIFSLHSFQSLQNVVFFLFFFRQVFRFRLPNMTASFFRIIEIILSLTKSYKSNR